MLHPPQPRSSTPRLALVDVLRGFAVFQMVVFHFLWDLSYFKWLHLAMNRDAPWIHWRAAIVTQFLLLVGVGLVLRSEFKPAASDFWKRWLQVAAAAALVSAGSALMFGERFIYFGVLHFVAVALLLTQPLLRLRAWLLLIGVLVVILGLSWQHEFFTPPGWNVFGFATQKPRTEDYVPLFPWLGVVWIGAGLASIWQRRNWHMVLPGSNLNAHPPRLLHFLGRWPLTIYLVHQPLLLAPLWLIQVLK